MSANTAIPTNHWLKGYSFDLPFLLAIPLLAIATGLVVERFPHLFTPILFLDLWLLGYHHVVSTYTRIGFSRASLQEHRFLALYLPFIVLAGTMLVAYGLGGWAIATTYLYWQWFHYTRQSYGVSRYYMAKTGNIAPARRDINSYALYLLPLTGILYRSYQSPESFLFMELKTLPVSYELVMMFLAASLAAIGLQLLHWIKQYRSGSLSWPYVTYMLSHHAVFATGYLLIEDINFGWLVLNIWHNAQYIGFVWLYNNKRFSKGIDPQQPLISKLSQNRKFVAYIGVCLLITFALYWVLDTLVTFSQPYTFLPMVLVVYMTVNFHHYIVDGMIWKRKRQPLKY